MLKLMTEKLQRQNSTTSLPSATRTKRRTFRRKFSYSLKRKREKRTAVQEENESVTEIKEIQRDFERFLEVVKEDLSKKTEQLRAVQKSPSMSLNKKGYARLQLFMLYKYENMLDQFSRESVKSILNMSKKLEATENKELVGEYRKIIEKLKRRMKRIIDMTDKYSVVEIFEAINVLSETSDDLDETGKSEGDLKRRSAISVGEINKESVFLGHPPLLRKSSSPSGAVTAFRALSEHFAFMTKNYFPFY